MNDIKIQDISRFKANASKFINSESGLGKHVVNISGNIANIQVDLQVHNSVDSTLLYILIPFICVR